MPGASLAMDIQGPLAALARSDLKPKLEALPQVEKAVASQQLQPEDYAEVINFILRPQLYPPSSSSSSAQTIQLVAR